MMAPKTPEWLATLAHVRVGNRPALQGGWLFEADGLEDQRGIRRSRG